MNKRYEDYKKYQKEIEREVKFTLFDKNFLIDAYNHSKELENQNQRMREHLLELEKRIEKLEGDMK